METILNAGHEAYIALVIILAIISLSLFLALVALFIRYQEVTRESIKGFQHILEALNAIRSDVQIGDNSLSNKMGDTERIINEKLENIKNDVLSHLQYIRDRVK